MYFIAIKGLNGWKARSRTLYTKQGALALVAVLKLHSASEYKICDADHEPGCSILKARHGFS